MVELAELRQGRTAFQTWMPSATSQHIALVEYRSAVQIRRCFGSSEERQVDVSLLGFPRHLGGNALYDGQACRWSSRAQRCQRGQQDGEFAVIKGRNAPSPAGLSRIERMRRGYRMLQRGQRLPQRFTQFLGARRRAACRADRVAATDPPRIPATGRVAS